MRVFFCNLEMIFEAESQNTMDAAIKEYECDFVDCKTINCEFQVETFKNATCVIYGHTHKSIEANGFSRLFFQTRSAAEKKVKDALWSHYFGDKPVNPQFFIN